MTIGDQWATAIVGRIISATWMPSFAKLWIGVQLKSQPKKDRIESDNKPLRTADV